VPIEHQASFLDISDLQRADFARLLRRTLDRLRRARNDPPYNFVIDCAETKALAKGYLAALCAMPSVALHVLAGTSSHGFKQRRGEFFRIYQVQVSPG
jgi:galactose-1-phosphate uridylyltransferase